MINIRQAVYDDIPRIMQFIDEHWKKGHIMGNDRTMFEFQHVRDKEVFYIIAEDTDDGKIYGTMGYIPMSEQEWACMSTVMIRSLKNPEKRLLGEEMARYFEKNMQCYNVFSVGIEKRYAKVLRKTLEEVGGAYIERLKHFYRLGECEDFRIAQIKNVKRPIVPKSEMQLVPLLTMDEFRNSVDLDEVFNDYPRRSPAYIEHRYYQHPYYSYQLFGLQGSSGIKCAIATREEEVEGRKILRIVDLFGKEEEFAHVGNAVDELLKLNRYEYIDFYCYGIDNRILSDAGFVERVENDENIIPNYFAPYLKENIEIYFYTWYLPNIHVYRGFGDQDRPNYIMKERGK